MSDVLHAAEFFDSHAMERVNEYFKIPNPFNQSYPYYFLFEVASSSEDSDDTKRLFELLDDCG